MKIYKVVIWEKLSGEDYAIEYFYNEKMAKQYLQEVLAEVPEDEECDGYVTEITVKEAL